MSLKVRKDAGYTRSPFLPFKRLLQPPPASFKVLRRAQYDSNLPVQHCYKETNRIRLAKHRAQFPTAGALASALRERVWHLLAAAPGEGAHRGHRQPLAVAPERGQGGQVEAVLQTEAGGSVDAVVSDPCHDHPGWLQTAVAAG